MEYRRLGTSDVRVSEVSLGCWTLGGTETGSMACRMDGPMLMKMRRFAPSTCPSTPA